LTFSFRSGAGDGGILRGQALEEALEELRARKAFLLMATPYLSFPVHLVQRGKGDLELRTTMTQDLAQRALGDREFKLRIPWGLGMVAGSSRLLSYRQEQGHRFLQVKTPLELVPDDRRRSIRVSALGQSRATLNPDAATLVLASLEDLSLHGARLLALEPLSEAFVLNRILRLSLSMDQGPAFDGEARLVALDGPSLSLNFEPPLSGGTLAGLEAWLKPKVEALQLRWEDRVALRAQAEAAARPAAPPEGVLLVSKDAALEGALRDVLARSLPLRTSAPALAPLKKAMEVLPQMVVLHWPGGGLQAKHLLKSLAAAFPSNTPVVVLGAGVEAATGRELALDIKASTYLDWNAAKAQIFTRLVAGLLRKHGGASGTT